MSHTIALVDDDRNILTSISMALENEGFKVTRIPVDRKGHIDPGCLREAVTEKTALVSLMAVNNEIGVVHPLQEIGQICREVGAYFHTDAAQAVGKIPIDVNEQNVDLLSISGHKIYGPKGIGALYIRRRPKVRIEAQINGGSQERGFRAGTLPTPLCVGIGLACEIAAQEMIMENRRLKALHDRLYERLTSALDNIALNGDSERRIPGNLNFSFTHIDSAALMMGIPDLSVSTGSACTSGSLGPSYILQALGLDAEVADTALRIGLGRFTTQEEVDYAAERLISVIGEQLGKESSHVSSRVQDT